jgi:hypothetical protein
MTVLRTGRAWLFFASLLPVFGHGSVPWRPLVVCEGPSGEAVLDDFVFTYYGQPVFQQQLVIRSPEINHWLDGQGVVTREISANFPAELIVVLNRVSPSDHRPLPDIYRSVLGTFMYELKVSLPELRFSAHDRETGLEAAHWIFRECRLAR